MKKTLLFIIVMLISMIQFNQVKAEETQNSDTEIIYNHSDNTTPLTYHSGNPVIVQKNIANSTHEFRGVYVYTKDNVDFAQQNTIDEFKQNYLSILDNLKKYNMNVIVFEVRPLNDAYYSSTLNPWSRFLTGTEGQDPGWDPLKWMIEQTHERGIAFYAGFNLFQVSEETNLSKADYLSSLSENNYAKKNPEQVLSVSEDVGKSEYFLDPGNSHVQKFILDSINELLSNYDIDALNIENYFYPISLTNSIDDADSYNTNNKANLTLVDWRRDNINNLMMEIKNSIDYINTKKQTSIQLGVSSNGVWDNYSEDNKLGSYTQGTSSYKYQYADTRLWVKKAYIDYIAPEINDKFEDPNVPYADIVNWWSNVVKNTNVHLLIGQYMNKNWSSPNQIIDQLRLNKQYTEIKGSLFFEYHNLNNPNTVLSSVLQTIETDYWNEMAFLPSLNDVRKPPEAVSGLIKKYNNNQMNVSWKTVNDARYYVVYRFINDETINLDDTSHIYQVINNQQNKDRMTFIDSQLQPDNTYYYLIVVINQEYNESNPVTFGIDLHPHKMFSTEVIVFTITSIIALGVIGFSALKTLKPTN